jgi:starch synthase
MKKRSPLTVLMAAAEAVPYAKSGGLADVTGSLPLHLAKLGHRVVLFVPYYRETRARFPHLPRAGQPLDLPVPGYDVRVELLQHDPVPGVTVLLVREDASFDRGHLYGTPDGDYWDNAGRFSLFCRAVIAAAGALGIKPDLVHAHDWQCALLPLYLRHRPDLAAHLGAVPSLFTVHNIAYQGIFPPAAMPYAGIPPHLFHLHGVEFFGNVNFLKAGILYADAVSTVSPRYSQEIRTPELGYGLDGVLRERGAAVHGILNGADYDRWDPATDPHLPARYDAASLAGKDRCKEELLREYGFAGDPGQPLVGTISRLADQKGFDILAAALPELVGLGYRHVFLGTGDRPYQDLFLELARRYPDRIAVRIGYDEALAHRIEAGADLFLMPSRYEPCGLNQLYSMRYGTIPIVRATGGLDDTVESYDPRTGAGTGFKFHEYSAAALVAKVREALAVFARPADRDRLRRNAMHADFSWEASASRYVELYRRLVAARRPG